MGMWCDWQDVQLAARKLRIDPAMAQHEWRDVARVHRFLDYCWAYGPTQRRERPMEELRRSAELKIGHPISRIAFEIAVHLLNLKPDRFDRIKFPLLAVDEEDLKRDLAEVERMIAEQNI